jgi:protein gp37
MGTTDIEWADSVWNPVTGCTPCATGCQHCYARRMANRLRGRFGYPAGDPFRVALHPERLDDPLRWHKPRTVFVCSMGDLLHDDVPSEYIHFIWRIMERCEHHRFIVLTKRPWRVAGILGGTSGAGLDSAIAPLPNVIVGYSASTQADLDAGLPDLLQTPAACRMLSLEPLCGPIVIDPEELFSGRIGWVVCGAETGPGARPMDLDWARSIRDQCGAVLSPFFFKRDSAGSRLLDGQPWEQWPAILRG